MTMKIEAGKFYRTRDGRKVGPMHANGNVGFHRFSDGEFAWGANGAAMSTGEEFVADLIAEWTDAPDLTAITTPFGLLDRETQDALKAHGGPWELWCAPCDWIEMEDPDWAVTCVYRVKPAPPKPRTIYLCEVHGTRTVFDTAMAATREALHYQHGEARVTEWEEKLK